MSTSTEYPSLHLHTYYRSSCSARVRIAAHLKNIPLSYTFIHLLHSDQHTPAYKSLNPSASVPTLTISPSLPSQPSFKITQSLPILLYLDSLSPSPPLLPSSPELRAHTLSLVCILACDTQPVSNLRVLKRVKALAGEEEMRKWAKEVMSEGLSAFEGLVREGAGRYCVGESITLADVCLAPAVEGGLRYGVDIDALPTVKRIYENIKDLDAFKKGDWRHQPDTPEEFREK